MLVITTRGKGERERKREEGVTYFFDFERAIKSAAGYLTLSLMLRDRE
jgi:hypothetical protein